MNKFERFNSVPEFMAPNPEEESRPSQSESVEDEENIQKETPACEPFKKTPKELKRIEEIRRQLKESVPTLPNQQEKPVLQNPTEIEVINGQQYHIEYVPKEEIYPAYGYAYGYGGGGSVVVRQDLPPRVKKFVKFHEFYHCQDKSNFGGWLGREIRANLIPGLKDPIGLVATVWKTITDIDRIKFYLKRIKEGH